MYENCKLFLVGRKNGERLATKPFKVPEGFAPTKISLKHKGGWNVDFLVFDTVVDDEMNVVLEVGPDKNLNKNQLFDLQDAFACGFEDIPLPELKADGKLADPNGPFEPIGLKNRLDIGVVTPSHEEAFGETQKPASPNN